MLLISGEPHDKATQHEKYIDPTFPKEWEMIRNIAQAFQLQQAVEIDNQ